MCPVPFREISIGVGPRQIISWMNPAIGQNWLWLVMGDHILEECQTILQEEKLHSGSVGTFRKVIADNNSVNHFHSHPHSECRNSKDHLAKPG